MFVIFMILDAFAIELPWQPVSGVCFFLLVIEYSINREVKEARQTLSLSNPKVYGLTFI